MSREAALEAFFEAIADFFEPAEFDVQPSGADVWAYLNNEYAITLPLDVVRVLWPEWEAQS